MVSQSHRSKVVRDFDTISGNDIGYAAKVYERIVGDDRMVFVDGCTNPKSITLLYVPPQKDS